MVKVVLICGLPGSGKTHEANRMASMEVNAVVVDDPGPGDLDKVLDLVQQYRTVIITDPLLCRDQDREAALRVFQGIPECSVETIWFRNEPEVCLENLLIRDGKDPRMGEFWVRNLSTGYHVPEGVQTLPCYRGVL